VSPSRRFCVLTAALVVAALLPACNAPETTGWGVNARADDSSSRDRAQAQGLLRGSAITYLRVDLPSSPDGRAGRLALYQEWRDRGFRIDAIAPFGITEPPTAPEDQLQEDLRLVYAEAEQWGGQGANVVDVWEPYNEPDLGFCRDLPDRFAAYEKAIYLGLKAGSGKSTPVLLPALGITPGPWLERAADNGMLHYGDAFNAHYYEDPRDLADYLRLVRHFLDEARDRGELAAPLPIWLTEIGYNDVPQDDLDNAAARQRQADYFSVAMQEASRGDLAVFMPYALHTDPGFALTNQNWHPYPAWQTVAGLTRSLSLSTRAKWVDQAAEASPVVLQWLPRPGSCLPHKVSGTYRFLSNDSPEFIPGVIRLYNFSTEEASGQVTASGLSQIRLLGWKAAAALKFQIPPMGMREWPITFAAPPRPGYLCERARFAWTGTGQSSSLVFGLETAPEEKDFVMQEIKARRPLRLKDGYQIQMGGQTYQVTSAAGPWIGLNGLTIDDAPTSARLSPGPLFSLQKESPWPAQPPMAVTEVSGLPASGFLRLKADRILGDDLIVRVDAIDKEGQRFAVYEFGGLNYFQPSSEAWLNMADFNHFGWGKFGPQLRFDPGAVRELQLRFYAKIPLSSVRITLQTAR
jgi:hypothetical protein